MGSMTRSDHNSERSDDDIFGPQHQHFRGSNSRHENIMPPKRERCFLSITPVSTFFRFLRNLTPKSVAMKSPKDTSKDKKVWPAKGKPRNEKVSQQSAPKQQQKVVKCSNKKKQAKRKANLHPKRVNARRAKYEGRKRTKWTRDDPRGRTRKRAKERLRSKRGYESRSRDGNRRKPRRTSKIQRRSFRRRY